MMAKMVICIIVMNTIWLCTRIVVRSKCLIYSRLTVSLSSWFIVSFRRLRHDDQDVLVDEICRNATILCSVVKVHSIRIAGIARRMWLSLLLLQNLIYHTVMLRLLILTCLSMLYWLSDYDIDSADYVNF